MCKGATRQKQYLVLESLKTARNTMLNDENSAGTLLFVRPGNLKNSREGNVCLHMMQNIHGPHHPYHLEHALFQLNGRALLLCAIASKNDMLARAKP